MLAPKITLRQLLWGIFAIACFLTMISSAWRGNLTMFGQSLAIALLPLLFLIFASAYWFLFACAKWLDERLSRLRNARVVGDPGPDGRVIGGGQDEA